MAPEICFQRSLKSAGGARGAQLVRRRDSSRRLDSASSVRGPRPRNERDQCSDLERKVRRPESSAPPGCLRPTTAKAGAPFSCSYPPGVPPCENPFPFIGLSLGRPPPNDPHREVAVLMVAYFADEVSQPGSRLRLQSGCTRRFRASGPPESDRPRVTPAGRRLRRRQAPSARPVVGAGQMRSDLRQDARTAENRRWRGLPPGRPASHALGWRVRNPPGSRISQ